MLEANKHKYSYPCVGRMHNIYCSKIAARKHLKEKRVRNEKINKSGKKYVYISLWLCKLGECRFSPDSLREKRRDSFICIKFI